MPVLSYRIRPFGFRWRFSAGSRSRSACLTTSWLRPKFHVSPESVVRNRFSHRARSSARMSTAERESVSANHYFLLRYFLRQAGDPNLSLRPFAARFAFRRVVARFAFLTDFRRFERRVVEPFIVSRRASRLAGVICAKPANPPGGIRRVMFDPFVTMHALDRADAAQTAGRLA